MIRIILIAILILVLVRMFAMSRKSAVRKPEIRFDSRMYKRKGISGSIGKLTGFEEIKKKKD